MARLQRGRAAAALCIASSSLLSTVSPAAAAVASHGSPRAVWRGGGVPRGGSMTITCFAAPSQRRLATMTAAGGGGGTGDQKPVVDPFVRRSGTMGKILILGGSGFLGSAVARRAVMDGFAVTSLSRRGRPPPSRRERRRGRIKGAGAGEAGGGGADAADKEAPPSDVKAAGDAALEAVDYRTGDARDRATVDAILSEGNYTGVVHCVGLLFDASSGLGNYNRLASGSGSIPDSSATYDDVTRLTAFNAIEAAEDAARREGRVMAFSFTSAAEAGWPDVPGGRFVEDNLAPDWLRRYLRAKRAVEERLMTSAAEENGRLLRPVIFRPSLIYSLDRVASLPPVGAFFVGNKLGLPFVDRPVSVQALSAAVVRSLEDENVEGVQRYKEIEALSK